MWIFINQKKFHKQKIDYEQLNDILELLYWENNVYNPRLNLTFNILLYSSFLKKKLSLCIFYHSVLVRGVCKESGVLSIFVRIILVFGGYLKGFLSGGDLESITGFVVGFIYVLEGCKRILVKTCTRI